jgi:glycosyltransferase involved in cell wall biosynthesis
MPAVRKPLVSVIVPVYRGERFLAAALDGVVKQTYRRVELIVVDDGSDDASAQIARTYAGARVLSEPHRGVSAARNTGVAAAQGELLAFLDADDLWLPQKLEQQVALMYQRAEVAIVHTHVMTFLTPEAPFPRWLPADWLTVPQPRYCPSNWLVRREAFTLVGPFDESFATAEEYQWLVRARSAGLESAMLDETLVRWRLHEANASNDQVEIRRGMMRMLRENLAGRSGGGDVD